MLIAHRGGSGKHAENTLASFSHAISMGFDGIEMDVRLTADGVPVLHHDAELNPARTLTEQGAPVPASAPLVIESLTFEQLRTYRLTGPLNNRAEPVPSLAEALGLIASLSPNCLVLVELKAPLSVPDTRAWKPLVDQVLALVEPETMTNPRALCSFNWDALAYAHQRNPNLPTWFLTHRLAKKGDYWQIMEQNHRLEGAGVAKPLDLVRLAKIVARRIRDLGGSRWFMHHSDFGGANLAACRAAGLLSAAWASKVLAGSEYARLCSLGEGALCLDQR